MPLTAGFIVGIIYSFITGYIIGAIPFAYLIARIWKGIDIREHGSGNPGATNVYRSVGKLPGVIALILDMAKGVCSVIVITFIMRNNNAVSAYSVISGLAAITGHTYTVFLNFKGGKGVATGLGVFAALAPLGVAAGLIAFAIVYVATRYVSAASITSAVVVPITIYLAKYPAPVTTGATIAALIIILRHRSNILRLIKNTETKTNL